MDKTPDRHQIMSSSNVLSTPVSGRVLRKSESGPVTSGDRNKSDEPTRSLRKLSSFTSPSRNTLSAQKRSYSSGDYSPPSSSPPSEPFLIPITPLRDTSPAGSENSSPSRPYRLPESDHTKISGLSAYQNAPHNPTQIPLIPTTGISIMAGNKIPPPPTSGSSGVQNQKSTTYPPPVSRPDILHAPPPSSQNQYQVYQPFTGSSQSITSTTPELSPGISPAPSHIHGAPPRLHVYQAPPSHINQPPPNQSSAYLQHQQLHKHPQQIEHTQYYPPPPSGHSPPTSISPPPPAYPPPASTDPTAPSLRPSSTLSSVGPPPLSATGTKNTGTASGTASPSRRRQQQQQQMQSQQPLYNSAPGGMMPKKKSRSPPRSRIDSNQMPRPKAPLPDAPTVIFHTKSSSGGRKVPPASTSLFTSVDSGNASPRVMRITTAAPPSTKSIAVKTCLPLAVVSTPFALPENEECDVPLVDMKNFGSTEGNPPRCEKCGAYINPNVTWTQGGTKWVCNLCGATNRTEAWYYCSLDGSQQRLDKFSRAELYQGSIDFAVSDDYCIRPPQDPVYVFCIDTSPRAISSGAMSASLIAVQHTINELYKWATGKTSGVGDDLCAELNEGLTMVDTFDNDENVDKEGCEGGHRIRIGIMTFGQHLNYFWVRPNAPEPIGICVVDPEDPFPALPPQSWLLSLCAQKQSIDMLLGRLPDLVKADPAFNIATSAIPSPPTSSAGLRPVQHTRPGATAAVSDSSRHILSYSSPTAALKGVQIALKEIGGRIVLLTDSNPDIGFGKIRRRPKMSIYGTESEFCYYGGISESLSCPQASSTITGPEEKSALEVYIALAQELASQNTSVDVFFFVPSLNSHAFMDPGSTASRTTSSQHHHASTDNSAVYAELCRNTGGGLHLFSGSLHLEDNVKRLRSELLHSVQAITGAEAVMKLRCSNGFRIEGYFGGGIFDPATDQVSMAGVDRDASFCFSLRNEAKLNDGDSMSIQLAILYTSLPSSQKIVRVHNFTLVTSTDPAVIYRHADPDSVVTFLCKMAASHALRNPLPVEKATSKAYVLGGSRRTPDIRQRVIDICVDILLNYRQLCSAHSPKGQLILPESLKVLPLYTLCILKHPCFMQNSIVGGATAASGGSTRLAVDCCERSFVLHSMLRATTRATMHSLYPRMYPLHDLEDGDGYPVDIDEFDRGRRGRDGRLNSFNEDDDYSSSSSNDDTGEVTDDITDPCKLKYQVQMPEWKKCSAESIDSDGVYLLDDGELLWLYFGRCVSQDFIRELLGITPGTSPPASNASPTVTQSKAIEMWKNSPPVSSVDVKKVDSTSAPTPTPLVASASFGSERLLLRLGSSGSVPPALQPRTERARRIQNIIQCARMNAPHRPELKIVWGGEINSSGADVLRFGVRLVEDSIYGKIAAVLSLDRSPVYKHELVLSEKA